jgi:steroid 5-alpha reductase family enzyme
MTVQASLVALAACLALALCGWIASLLRRDVSLVDSLWSLMVLGAAIVAVWLAPTAGTRAGWLIALAALWAVRLSAHITCRGLGTGEDRRYRAIRARNQPNFALKSAYLVFGLQALLAWIVALPLTAAAVSQAPPNWLDAAGAALALFGIAWESVADWQLARFTATRAPGAVLDTGLWRYSRHPNYFGEFCVWWGFWLVALGAGGWWTVLSPVLMTVLLLRISGVALLERDIGERRPAYRDYMARTNAFFPGPSRGA